MSNLINAFLIVVMFISVWPSMVYVVGQVMAPIRASSVLCGIQLGRAVGSKRPPHPADPPVCMAKLIMLRHRMQQASTRRSLQRTPAAPRTHVHGYPRHRSISTWAGQTMHQSTTGRRWGNNTR